MNLVFFGPKMAASWRTSAFHKKKKLAETPIFIVFLGCALFGPRCQKKKIWNTHQKRKKWLITGKLFVWYFCVFQFLFFSCWFFWLFLFSLFLCFLGPPHLALNPPFLFFFCFCFVFVFVICLFLSFLCFLIHKNLVFPLEKGIFCLVLSVSLCFSLAFFWPPPFSISLSLSLSCSCPFFFLLVFLVCFLLVLVYVSFFPFLSSLLLFHERNNIKIFNCNLSLHQHFLLVLFPVLCFLSNPFFLSLLFPDFKLCFWFNINVFGFKTNSLTKQKFLVKRGVATKRFLFIWTCVLQNVKTYHFLPFLGNVWLMFKKHYKIDISAHF